MQINAAMRFSIFAVTAITAIVLSSSFISPARDGFALHLSLDSEIYPVGTSVMCDLELKNNWRSPVLIYGDFSQFSELTIKDCRNRRLMPLWYIYDFTTACSSKINPGDHLTFSRDINFTYHNNPRDTGCYSAEQYFLPGKYTVQAEYHLHDFFITGKMPAERVIKSNTVVFTVVEPASPIDQEAFELLKRIWARGNERGANAREEIKRMKHEFVEKYGRSAYGPLGYYNLLNDAMLLADKWYDDDFSDMCRLYPDDKMTMRIIESYIVRNKDLKINNDILYAAKQYRKKYPQPFSAMDSIINHVGNLR